MSNLTEQAFYAGIGTISPYSHRINDDLIAALRAYFLIAVRVVRPARRDVAIRAVIPPGKMKFARVVGNSLKNGSVGIFDITAHVARRYIRA